MKKYLLLFFIFCTATIAAFAQSKRANVWYQAYGMGINFNCNPPCPLENPVMQDCFSSATICDKNGNLQFYTDNETIWNSNNEVMLNGTNLHACRWSEQGCLIVPLTSNPNQYFLVTCDQYREPANLPYTVNYVCFDIYPVKNILSLHLIDMSVNNGKGAVLWKNKIIYNSGYVNSMLAAVKHANTKDTWVMTYDYNTNRFISLLLTDCGIQDTIISPDFGIQITGSDHPITFSPKGDLMHVRNENVHGQNGYMIAHFNTATGELYNPFFFKGETYKGCFSTDSRYLYTIVDYMDTIPRYDLSITDTAAIYTNRKNTFAGSLKDGYNNGVQNGPDGKMYFNFNYNYVTWYVCENPLEPNPVFTRKFTPVTKVNKPLAASANPPNFVQSWFDPDFKEYEYGSPSITYQRVCIGNKTTLIAQGVPPATPWHWEVSENNIPVTYYYNEDTISHLFVSSGLHTVRLVIDFPCKPDVITKNDVFVDGYPIPDYIKDTVVCEGSSADLFAQSYMESYAWNTGNVQQQQIAAVNNTYIVTVSNTCGTQKDSAVVTNVEYKITNLVTLNHDNMNEVISIQSNTEALGKLEIYNSWGSRIYSNNAYNDTWPEKEIEAGVYFYRYEISSCKPENGWVQVLTK